MAIESVAVRCDTCHKVVEVGLWWPALESVIIEQIEHVLEQEEWIVVHHRGWHFCSKKCADTHKAEFPAEYPAEEGAICTT